MKKLFSTLIFLGSVLLLGTAGASDCNTIDGSQILLQVSIAAFMIGGGYLGLQLIKKIASGTINTESEYEKKYNIKIIAPIRRAVNAKF